MSRARLGHGELVSALGAVLLAVSVFLPWYGVSFTAGGVSEIQQLGHEVVGRYGNALLQSEWGGLQAGFNALAGHELGTVSAHQALHTISVLLLVLAGAGLLLSLRALAAPGSSLAAVGGGWIAAIGAAAAALVLYRILSPPLPDNGFVRLSVQAGAWLALTGALLMCAGSAWPRRTARAAPERALEDAWSQLSGWTPRA
jgi:hypothetical protein